MSPPLPRPGALAHRLRLTLVLVCFFLSGATSLVLETAWSKQLSYLLGTDLHGAATTVVAYMGGLGLGAWLAARLYARIQSPLAAYAGLQGLIGLFGIVSIPLLRSMHPVFAAVHGLGDSHVFLLLRFLITFGLLLPSTIWMGMTLPMVLGAYRSARVGGGTAAGLLYGANTLGAVAGTLGAGLWLVPSLGLWSTCLSAGIVDLGVGAAAYVLHLGSRRSTEPAPEPVRSGGGAGVEIRVAYAIAGGVALGLELCWFRLMGQIIGPTAHALSVTLAVFLLGIALGSLATSRWAGRSGAAVPALGLVLLATAVLALWPVYYLDRLPAWLQALWVKDGVTGTPAALLFTQAINAGALMLPATLSMGAALPLAVAALTSKTGRTEESAVLAAELFYVNTFGAVVGTVLWGFVVIPGLGVHDALRAAAACSLGAGALVLACSRRALARRPLAAGLPAASVALLGVLLWARAPDADSRVMNIGVYQSVRSTRSGEDMERAVSRTAELVFVRDGLNGTVAVVKNRYGYNELDLVYFGKWVATTAPGSRPHLVYLAHLPMLLARAEPEEALVVGLGSGITTGALLRYPELRHVDVVEIEPAVVEASQLFERYNRDPLGDPRTRLTLQDGRTFLAFGKRRYDVITSDPIHPWVKGAANLYTVEYYRQAAARLSPGGIFAQWIPSSMSKESFDVVLRTLKAVFPEVSLFIRAFDVVALAAAEPVEVRSDAFDRRVRSREVQASLRSIGMTPRKLFAKLEVNLRPARVEAEGLINTDDNVFLEHRLPWDTFHGHNALSPVRKGRRTSSKR